MDWHEAHEQEYVLYYVLSYSTCCFTKKAEKSQPIGTIHLLYSTDTQVEMGMYYNVPNITH